jgi:hypothetical protein
MGSSKGIQSWSEFYSYQLILLCKLTKTSRDKYSLWWNGLKKDYIELSNTQLNEIIALALKDPENSRSEAELRAVLAAFLSE